MPPLAPIERTAAPAPNRLSRALIRLLMKQAYVKVNERVADRFHLITLEGPALQKIAWMSGQKIQIAMGSAFTTRTYTPIAWNAAAGRACLLGYAHGDGPGSAWLQAASPGESCEVFGPRPSIDVDRRVGRVVLFGDETSIGLAHALAQHDPQRLVDGCFEVAEVEMCRDVMAQVGLTEFALVARDPDDAHLARIEDRLVASAGSGATFVLTGRAGAIRCLRRKLKALEVPTSRIVTKVYWSPGKTGLD